MDKIYNQITDELEQKWRKDHSLDIVVQSIELIVKRAIKIKEEFEQNNMEQYGPDSQTKTKNDY